MRRRRTAVAVAALTGLALAACGGPAAPPDGQGERETVTVTPAPTGVRTPAPPPPAVPAEPSPDPAAGPPRTPPAAQESLRRAVWVHLFDGALKTRPAIRAVVADLAGAGATAVVAEVVRRQDAYYRSDVLPGTPDPTLEPGLDVLAVLLEEAHAAGLEVHAWVPVAPTWHATYEGLPAPAGWVTAEHGRDAPEGERWVTRTVDGVWDEYLDPALPEVQAHVAAVVGELAARYDVDGVHLDYVRYASARHGYHPRALDRYRAETGASGTPDPADPAWSAWRRDQVTALVQGARDAVRATGSGAVLSAAVITWGEGPGGPGVPTFAQTRAATEALQDWERWAVEGTVDALLPMNYNREGVAEQAGWLRTWLTWQRDLAARTGTPVVPGIAGYLNAPGDVVVQLRDAQAGGGPVALYSYQGSTEDEDRPLWRDLAATDWGTG